jgi:DNA modification methylase
MNKVIQGDCVLVMQGLESNSVDLTVTSPPYDNLRDYGNNWTLDTDAIISELYRITREGGVVVWVVGDAVVNGSETGTSFRQALKFMDAGFRLHDTMIYMKNGAPFPDRIRYSQVFEYMFVFSKGKPKTFNPIKDKPNRWAGTSNFGTPSSRNKKGEIVKRDKYVVAEFGTRYNVWQYNVGKGYSTKDEVAYQHPAIFPDKLAQDHIISWTNEGDLVFDPFMGSGTTAVAARELNRNWLGAEINEEYIRIIDERIK